MAAAAGTSINFDELSRELATMRSLFDQWNQSTARSLEDLKTQHIRKLDDSRAVLAGLDKKQQQLVEQTREVRARLATEREQLEGLQRELTIFRDQEAALPQQLGHLKQVLESEEARLAKKEKGLAEQAAVQRKKMAALHQAVQLYSERLGLTFTQPEDGKEELQLVFTHVDPRDPERQFMFAVRVQEDDTYEVTKCAPQVNNIDEYLVALNKSTNFCSFVRAMRREFRRMVEPQ